MSTLPQPLSSLALSDAESQASIAQSLGVSTTPVDVPEVNGHRFSFGMAILWFLIIAVIAWLILYATNPTMIQKTLPDGTATGEIDYGKLLLAAVVIGVIILIIIWLFWSAW